MATGGGNVDIDQIIALTREIATVAAKQDQTLTAVNQLQNALATNYVPRPEIEAKHEDHNRRIVVLEGKEHKKFDRYLAVCSLFVAVVAVGVATWGVIHK